MSHKKSLMKKNAVDKASPAEAVAVAFTKTILPSHAEKAALTATAATTMTATTMPAEGNMVRSVSTNPPIPPPASTDCPAIGAKSPKAQYLPSSAKALVEVAASNQ